MFSAERQIGSMDVRMTRCPGAILFLALGLGASCTSNERPQSESAPKPAGEWRSTTRVADRPEVTLTFATASTASSSMSLRGERRGIQEWATMPLANAIWDGTQMTFETVLPDNEGKVYWTFRPVARNRARLAGVPDDADLSDPPIQWSLETP
jgi:hypothetical protein